MKKFLQNLGAVCLILPALVFTGIGASIDYQFNQNLETRLIRASHAPDVEIALEEFKVVQKYLSDNNLSSGNSSIWLDTVQNDVTYFKRSIDSSVNDLTKLSKDPEASKNAAGSNELLRIEQTFKATGEKGADNLRMPSSLSRFPNQRLWFFGGGMLWIVFVFGFLSLLIINDEWLESMNKKHR
jgi:hypothetical protein